MKELPGQVINEALDAGTAVVGGLCLLFYLLLGVAATLTDLSHKRRQERLYRKEEERR